MHLNKLAETIFDVIKAEHEDLEKHGEGIFFCPELALAYLIGKKIDENKRNVFGTEKKVIWQRERDLGNGGPSDIIFADADNGHIPVLVIEVKIRSRSDLYRGDIEKLIKLNEEYPCCKKIFCALVDVFKDGNKRDGRVDTIDEWVSNHKVKRIEHPISFDAEKYGAHEDQCRIQCRIEVLEVQ